MEVIKRLQPFPFQKSQKKGSLFKTTKIAEFKRPIIC